MENEDKEIISDGKRGGDPYQNGRRKPAWRWKSVLVILMSAACLVGAITASGTHLIKGKIEDSLALMQTVDKDEIIQMTNSNINEESSLKLKDSWTVAAFGLDSRDGDGLTRANSDVIMLITLNGKTGDVRLASVYRDTCLKTGNGSYRKANSAYASGGPKRAVSMLNENLDLRIDDYIAVNWKAVADAVNILGGVDLDITDSEFEYINSFITETVESTNIPSSHLSAAGPNHLDGVQAVAYCRLRLMDDDFKRTERQRKILGLLLDKCTKADLKTLDQLIATLLPQTSSSIGPEDLYAVAGNIKNIKEMETLGFPSTKFCRIVDGSSYVFPDTLEKNVKVLHQFLYGTSAYTPSDAVKSISSAVMEKSQKGQAAEKGKTKKNPRTHPIIKETSPTPLLEEKGKAEEPEDTEKAVIPSNEPSIAQPSMESTPYGPGYDTATEGTAVAGENGGAAGYKADKRMEPGPEVTEQPTQEIGPHLETEGYADVYLD